MTDIEQVNDPVYLGGQYPPAFPTGDVSSHISTRNLSFAELASSSLVVDTGVLEKSKEALLGVPHIITTATFWIPAEDQRGFVSLECVIADETTLRKAIRRNWIPNVTQLDQLPFDPEDRVIYNDGGTGIRRTTVQILTHLGRVEPGPVTVERDFDKPWPQWDAYDAWTFQNDDDGETKVQIPCFRGLNIAIKHGLRVSEYTKDKIPGTTYYLS